MHETLRRGGTRPWLRAAWLATTLSLPLAALSPALAQDAGATLLPDFSNSEVKDDATPLLPESISEFELDMRGRYAWQWRTADGTLVVLYTGDFRLTFGRRKLSADDAVVWIEPRTDNKNRQFAIVTVYLSGNAEVQESGGTTTVDRALLVSNLRTYGDILKSQDSHTQQSAENTDLYKRALLDRERVEAGLPLNADYSTVRRPSGPKPPDPLRAQRVVRYDLQSLETVSLPDGSPAYVASGGVYFSQGGAGAEFVEIRAQNAVVFPAEGGIRGLGGDELGVVRQQPPAAAGAPPAPRAAAPADGAPLSDATGLGRASSAVGERIRAVYLEGDVVLSSGSRFVRAPRIYYDFELDRALILDAVFRADVADRGVPLYVRADEIRQLSATEIEASNARITSSEFFTPHYHVGVDRLYLRDLGTQARQDDAGKGLAAEYVMEGATLNVNNTPLLAWPRAEGRVDSSETLLRRFRIGYDGDFGGILQTSWYLFNLMGTQAPPGFDATLRLDAYSDRGPATGVNLDYEREDYYGLLRTYFVNDRGLDTQIGPLRQSEWNADQDNRGRALFRHRQYLENDWQLTLEMSYVSDPNFLEIYERSEWFEGKEQETVIFLKRARDTEAITFLANWRLLDFVTQTEHLPDLEYRRIGDLLGDTGLVSYSEARLGAVRYRPDDRRYFDERTLFGIGRPFANDGLTDLTVRADAREELEYPLKLGALNLVPFGTVRGTYWDSQPYNNGGLWRGIGIFGLRGATTFAKVYDGIRSELLDIDKIRHIVKPNFMVWGAGGNERSANITPFDEGIETIDDFYGVKFGVQQIWQTKRGPADRRRTVDLASLNLEVGAFGDAQANEISNGYVNMFRPEDSRTRNYFAGDLMYRLSDSTTFLYDFNFDLNDQSYDRHSIAVAVERNPRLSYVFGARYAGDIDLNFVGGGFNYKYSEKHITAVRFWHDIDTGELGEVSVAYIRKLPRWYAGISFEYDSVDDDFRISMTLWPEGIPEWALGSRRFTGLATSTGIRP